MVRPLFYFDSDGLQTFDQATTDDFEGVTDFELNDIRWTGPNPRRLVFGLLTLDPGPPSVIDEHYDAFDLDGQVLNLIHFLNLGVNARHLVGNAEWVLVATGRFDLPRLHELATRYAGSFGVELPDEEPLLFLANLDEELWADLAPRWRPPPTATPDLVEMYSTALYTRS